MATFDPGLERGQVIDNARLCEIFKCSTQGGMRRSHTTSSLVIVSNHVKSIYDDRWLGDTFHYTGMGMRGDQNITSSQNRTLAESGTNGVSLFLFEVDESGRYRFQGPVRLAGSPYEETQPDDQGIDRRVWVFPLRLVAGEPEPVPVERFRQEESRRQRKARKLSDEEIRRLAERAPKTAGQRQTTGVQFERNPYVVEQAKRRAAGVCELCRQPAPFNDANGKPYLETHHIEWLSQGGEDSIENTVALCPNCHRRMHVLDLEGDKAVLRRPKP